jgi:hypothetical protein
MAASHSASSRCGATFHMTAHRIKPPSSIDDVVRRHCVNSVAI